MRQLGFYEFAGVLVPGTVVVIGLLGLAPMGEFTWVTGDVSVGQFSILLFIAYAAGHLVQGVGNLIEIGWWRLWKGMPTSWPRTHAGQLLGEEAEARLMAAIRSDLHFGTSSGHSELPVTVWRTAVRHIYTRLRAEGTNGRVDIFSGNYGLARGLLAAGLILVAVSVLREELLPWQAYAVTGVLCLLTLFRMHRFGVLYARELFVQFLADRVQPDSVSVPNTGECDA